MVAAARKRRVQPGEGGGEAGTIASGSGAGNARLVYDEVKEAGVVGALAEEAEASLDVCVAADVLCYISDLRPFLAAGLCVRAFMPVSAPYYREK
jgi:hypothetical protein